MRGKHTPRHTRKKTSPPPRAERGGTALVKIVTAFYVLLMIVVPPHWVNVDIRRWWAHPRNWVYELVDYLHHAVGMDSPTGHTRFALYLLLIAFLLPWLVMAVFRRGRPVDLGWRRPNRLTPRMLAVSSVVAAPFLWWMVRGAGFAVFYQRYLDAGLLTVACYFGVVLFCEHFFFHGVMPAAFRPGHRWPHSARLDRSGKGTLRRLLQWLGFAQPVDGARGLPALARWLGLQEGCAGAILMSGLLFGAVHSGKDGRELFLSYPGGVFLGYMAYRCNSWFAPFFLHIGTVAIAGTMFLLLRSG